MNSKLSIIWLKRNYKPISASYIPCLKIGAIKGLLPDEGYLTCDHHQVTWNQIWLFPAVFATLVAKLHCCLDTNRNVQTTLLHAHYSTQHPRMHRYILAQLCNSCVLLFSWKSDVFRSCKKWAIYWKKSLKNIFFDQSSACKLKISLSLDYTLLEFFMRKKWPVTFWLGYHKYL